MVFITASAYKACRPVVGDFVERMRAVDSLPLWQVVAFGKYGKYGAAKAWRPRVWIDCSLVSCPVENGGQNVDVRDQVRVDYPLSASWLYKDGISLLFVRHHVEEGMGMPDRGDFDADTPQSHGVKHVTDASFGPDVEWQR